MISQADGMDQAQFGEAIVEAEGLFEEAITIRRFSAQSSTPGAFGTNQKATFTDFAATAMMVEMGVAQKMISMGIMEAGDIFLQMRDRLNEGSANIGGAQIADRVVFRGMEYRMVQRPQPVAVGAGLGPDVPHFIVQLRRTNSTADTVGG